MDFDEDQSATLFANLDLTNPDDPVKEHKSKKEKKDEKMIIWKDVRKKKKERIKEKRIEKKLVYKTKAEYEQSDLYKRRRMEEEMKKKWKDVTIDQIEFFKPWVVVDLNYNELLEARELTSLASQLMHIYASLKRAERPLKAIYCNYKGLVVDYVNKLSGVDTWKVYKEERCFSELYDKSKLVYLSPDSPNVLTHVDPEKIYIIGGIVDHNRLKDTSLNRAEELGIETAQLPLVQHMPSFSKSNSLNVNHVFDILMDVAQNNDWAAALNRHVPQRRGYHRNKQVPRKNPEDEQQEGTSGSEQGAEEENNNTNER